MNWTEANPLPKECHKCRKLDCYDCDYAGQRWSLSQAEALLLRRRGLLRAAERLQRQISAIERQLEEEYGITPR